jgi:hypothetical protein
LSQQSNEACNIDKREGGFTMKNGPLLLTILTMFLGMILVSLGCKKDDSAPSGPAASTSTFSFNTDDGNFSASGPFNASATSGSGVGWMAPNIIAAYSITSPTRVSVVTMAFAATPTTQGYSFPNQAGLAWMLNVNPNDSTSIYAGRCMATRGSIILSSHGGGASQGTFSGSGAHVQTPTDTCAITNGTFTIYTGTAKASALPPQVERILRTMTVRNE